MGEMDHHVSAPSSGSYDARGTGSRGDKGRNKHGKVSNKNKLPSFLPYLQQLDSSEQSASSSSSLNSGVDAGSAAFRNGRSDVGPERRHGEEVHEETEAAHGCIGEQDVGVMGKSGSTSSACSLSFHTPENYDL